MAQLTDDIWPGRVRQAVAIFAVALVGVTTLALTGCGPGSTAASSRPSTTGPSRSSTHGPGAASPSRSQSAAARAGSGVPRPTHTVVVVLENHSYSEIIGNPQAPFINALARQGAMLTASYAITHPSEPNYLALFSGSTQGITSDQCPTRLTTPNLAADLIAAHLSFAGYAEGLPGQGSPACVLGEYARKHVPWADFTNVPGSVSLPFSRFPTNFGRLPTVSFVVPNLCNDMHDCSVATGDGWLRTHIGGYARWAMTHNSLLVVTWDEDDGSQSNQIATIFAGQQVLPGRYHQRIDHYTVLRTIEQAYGLRHDGRAASRRPLTGIWRVAG